MNDPQTTSSPQRNLTWPEKAVMMDKFARVMNIIILTITSFILLSLIVYGTRKRRWRTSAGGSSLNSGVTFVCSVIATALTLPRLVTNEIIHSMRINQQVILDCSKAGYITGAFYFIPQYGFYVFLCILLRKIYAHPYVKNKIKGHYIVTIYVFSAVSTVLIIVAGILSVYFTPVKWYPTRGCHYAPTIEGPIVAVVVSIMWIIIQAFMVFLYVHAAYRTHLVSKQHIKSENGDERETYCSDICKIFCDIGAERIVSSPVELTVKRGVKSVVGIVASDVTLTITTVYVLPPLGVSTFPAPLLDVSVLFNVFCVIAALGCSGQVLGWWIPKCPTVLPTRDRSRAVMPTNSSSEGKD